MDYKQLNEDFLEAYHKPELERMILCVRKILYERLETFAENKHYKALDHFMDMAEAINICGGQELPAMLYGMIWEAWKKLFWDVQGREMDISDFTWERT